METFETFMNIFRRALLERNGNDLQNILEQGPKYFRDISRSDSETILGELFHGDYGLLFFLNAELSRIKSQKTFDMALKEGFGFLKFVVEHFNYILSKLEIHATNIKNTCALALTTSCSFNVQKAAATTYIRFVELFHASYSFTEEVDLLSSYFAKLNMKERSLVLAVLCAIAKYSPEPLRTKQSLFNLIFHQLRNDFKKQYKPQQDHQVPEIETYLNAFSNLLAELGDLVEDQYWSEMYDWIKKLSLYREDQRKKVIMRSAINLLSEHIEKFAQFVYKDHEHWCESFTRLTNDNNKDQNECGERALKKLYRVIGAETLKERNSEFNKSIFMHFKNYFEKELEKDAHLQSNKFHFIVYGYSQMAASCKLYLTSSDVRRMFLIIAQRAKPFCFIESVSTENLESVSHYLEALSEIIVHMDTLSIDEIHTLTKLSALLIKNFPELPVTSQNHVIMALRRMIISIDNVHKYRSEELLYNLIEEGIIWSCSHTLLIDAELQRELRNLKERPVCYQNYLPLWSQLVNLHSGSSLADKHIAQQVTDTVIRVCIVVISKLNLNTIVKDDDIYTDAVTSETAVNKSDFRIFINIVDLYVDILSAIKHELFLSNVQEFLVTLIKLSYKHPHVSGFYKLVRQCCRYIDRATKEDLQDEIMDLLYNYLFHVSILAPTLCNELLITCLYLVLDIPSVFVERLLDYTIPAFKISFNIGLSDFELAYTALDTLEKWVNHLEKPRMKIFLQKIISPLASHLQNEESVTAFSQEIIKTERKIIKHIVLLDKEKNLENFQRRILLFIASLDTDIVTDFLYKRSLETGATWDKKDLLKCSLPLFDVKVDIYFDSILPRLITLAENSSDRPTKVTACEVLYAMVVYLLGKTSETLTLSSERYLTAYKRVCPALLKLGCDNDEVARQFFQPLMLQLTHWLSSNIMLSSPITPLLLESLFNGLCDESNSALREFCGTCLAEFTYWSLNKNSGDELKPLSNIDGVINKMMHFALHPSETKRIAAAVAFNHLYTILCEEEQIVSEYWIYVFYCFVNSLKGCNDRSISKALDHVLRSLISKQFLFHEPCDNRKKPHEFANATLMDTANWLLAQCGSLDQHLRKKSMELFLSISECVEGHGSAESIIHSYINERGIEAFNRIILGDMDAKIEKLALDKPENLLRTVDCYIWLINEKIIPVELLFSSENRKKEVIFDCIQNFIRLLIDSDKMHMKLLYKVIMTIFNFLEILLHLEESFIPDSLLRSELFELISIFIMKPVTNFDANNFESFSRHSNTVENLLKLLIEKKFYNSSVQDSLKEKLAFYVDQYIDDYLNLQEIVCGRVTPELKQYVKGLITLEHSEVLEKLYKDKCVLGNREEKITSLFEVLCQERIGEIIYININPQTLDYLRDVMELHLVHYQPQTMSRLIDLVANDITPSNEIVPQGLHFLNLFKDSIFTYMLKNIEQTMEIFKVSLQETPSVLLTIVEGMMLFVQRHKKEFQAIAEQLVDTLTRHFAIFERAVNNVEERREKLISIFGIAVSLKQNPTELSSINLDYHTWVLHQLNGNFDIMHKTRILQCFLPSLADSTTANNPALVAILYHLIVKEKSNQNLITIKEINCFQTLVTLLPITKSIIVLESVVLSAASAAEKLYNEKTVKYLEKYFKVIGSEQVLQSLDRIYTLFMDINRVTNERLDILNKFCIPCFQFCTVAEIEKFFERNIKEICTVINQNVMAKDLDVTQTIVSKIGCYNMISIMFAKLPIENIDSVNSCIARAAVDNLRTGNELLLQLFGSTVKLREQNLIGEHKEFMRQLHCAAYNCCIAIVSVRNNEDSYLKIFAETPSRRVWENIVDSEKIYNIQQTFKEYPKNRKRLVIIRNAIRTKQGPTPFHHIHTYDLSYSSLTQDVTSHDLNEFIVQDNLGSTGREESLSLTLECDELNDHECMASICGVLDMMRRTIPVSIVGNAVTIPKWLKCFFQSMMQTSNKNVKLFMLKIISNVPALFESYAEFASRRIMHVIYQYLIGGRLNYIITDVLMLLIEWRIVQKTEDVEASAAVQKLWELLIDKVAVSNAKDTFKAIYNFNISIIKSFLEVWHDSLTLPGNLSIVMDRAPKSAVYLILLCFENGMERKIIDNEGILEFLDKSIENWQNSEEIYLQACECVGSILEFYSKDEEYLDKGNTLKEKVKEVLLKIQMKNESRLIKCIYAVSRHWHEAALIYSEFITANIAKVGNWDKAKCLEIFVHRINYLSMDMIRQELRYLGLQHFLKNKVEPCDKVALQIICRLTTVLPVEDIHPFAQLVLPYTKSNVTEHRKMAYNIFMSIYKQFSLTTSSKEIVDELIKLSKELLMSGVLDPDEDLQREVLLFWTENAGLSVTSLDRLLEVFHMYTGNVGPSFLPFALIMMLDLTSKSLDYGQPIFKPLHDCPFINYKISTFWRTKNSMAPAFAPSLASQINQETTQFSARSSSTLNSLSNDGQFPRGVTQALQLQSTLSQNDPSTFRETSAYDLEFQAPERSQSSNNKRSPRFLSDRTKISKEIRQVQIKKNIRYDEMMKEEMKRQRGSVKVYRQYRIGDFPDVEISLKSLVELLQQIVKRDQHICKDLTVAICHEIVQQKKYENCHGKVLTSLKHILSQSPQNSSLTSAIFETLLCSRMLDFPTSTVMRISKSNNLNCHGTLLLEEALIYNLENSSPPSKRMRTESDCNSSDTWLQLGSLYESINDVDIVLSIFQNHIHDEDMQEAAFAHAAQNWGKAKDAFTRTYERGPGTMQERSLQGLFECCNNLCSWSEIDRRIQNVLNDDLNQIWDHPWKDWLFPFLLETEVQKLLTLYSIRDSSNLSPIGEKDCSVLNSWLVDKQKQEHLKTFFGEQFAIFFTFLKKEEHALDFLLNTIDEMRRQWIRLHPLSMELRLHKLQDLRHINDVNNCVRLLKKLSFDYSPLDLQQLLKFWSSSEPGDQDFILLWDKLISYRLYFISILEERQNLNRYESQDNSADQLYQISLKMQLGIVKAALNQKNTHIAQKYLNLARKKINTTSHFYNEFLLEATKIMYLNGVAESNMHRKMEHFGTAWEGLQKLLKLEGLDSLTQINVTRQLNKLSLEITSTCRRNSVFAELLSKKEKILRDIETEGTDVDSTVRSLEAYSFSRLKESYKTQSVDSIKEGCLAITKYCYDKLSADESDIIFRKEFVRSTLKGMTYGSLECAQYFPCLLSADNLNDHETREIFLRETETIESWMFISWQAQLFSQLGTDIAYLIIPIIQRIADAFPNAVIYTLGFAIELNPVLATSADIYKIRSIIYNNPEIEKFLRAMQYVVQPELYLRYYLLEFRKGLSEGIATALDNLLKKVYPNPHEFRNNPRPGGLFREIARYEKEIKSLGSRKVEEIKKWVDITCETLKKQLEKRRDREKLNDYSPWLCNFNGSSLEIPGQYTGNRRPMPQYHNKIVKLEPFVKVMQSLRKPIKITMIGNNAREYNFLVKFGEDLRQDQRLQQIFSIMNNTLETDTTCKHRKLSIDTYQVIPLSKSLGLIEWIDDTQCLRNLIHYNLSADQIRRYERVRTDYQSWIHNAAPAERSLQYKKALIKYGAGEVVAQMKKYISETDWDALRSTFKVLSPSVESFMTLRRNFISSYATMCIAHWILGIGDRHLENTLIVISSGRCLGIDFGLAFEAGVDLPIPEIVPFRLTPQILGLLKPFGEKDLMGATMNHVLSALREGQGPILACLQVFVHEPLAWVESVNKAFLKSGSDQADVKWFPKKKIDMVTKKLNGIKPSVLTLQQLKQQHNDKYYERYYHIVTGDDDIKQVRASFPDNCLSVEDQVTCLLDQATDLNILGRMYVNWTPWL